MDFTDERASPVADTPCSRPDFSGQHAACRPERFCASADLQEQHTYELTHEACSMVHEFGGMPSESAVVPVFSCLEAGHHPPQTLRLNTPCVAVSFNPQAHGCSMGPQDPPVLLKVSFVSPVGSIDVLASGSMWQQSDEISTGANAMRQMCMQQERHSHPRTAPNQCDGIHLQAGAITSSVPAAAALPVIPVASIAASSGRLLVPGQTKSSDKYATAAATAECEPQLHAFQLSSDHEVPLPPLDTRSQHGCQSYNMAKLQRATSCGLACGPENRLIADLTVWGLPASHSAARIFAAFPADDSIGSSTVGSGTDMHCQCLPQALRQKSQNDTLEGLQSPGAGSGLRPSPSTGASGSQVSASQRHGHQATPPPKTRTGAFATPLQYQWLQQPEYRTNFPFPLPAGSEGDVAPHANWRCNVDHLSIHPNCQRPLFRSGRSISSTDSESSSFPSGKGSTSNSRLFPKDFFGASFSFPWSTWSWKHMAEIASSCTTRTAGGVALQPAKGATCPLICQDEQSRMQQPAFQCGCAQRTCDVAVTASAEAGRVEVQACCARAVLQQAEACAHAGLASLVVQLLVIAEQQSSAAMPLERSEQSALAEHSRRSRAVCGWALLHHCVLLHKDGPVTSAWECISTAAPAAGSGRGSAGSSQSSSADTVADFGAKPRRSVPQNTESPDELLQEAVVVAQSSAVVLRQLLCAAQPCLAQLQACLLQACTMGQERSAALLLEQHLKQYATHGLSLDVSRCVLQCLKLARPECLAVLLACCRETHPAGAQPASSKAAPIMLHIAADDVVPLLRALLSSHQAVSVAAAALCLSHCEITGPKAAMAKDGSSSRCIPIASSQGFDVSGTSRVVSQRGGFILQKPSGGFTSSGAADCQRQEGHVMAEAGAPNTATQTERNGCVVLCALTLHDLARILDSGVGIRLGTAGVEAMLGISVACSPAKQSEAQKCANAWGRRCALQAFCSSQWPQAGLSPWEFCSLVVPALGELAKAAAILTVASGLTPAEMLHLIGFPFHDTIQPMQPHCHLRRLSIVQQQSFCALLAGCVSAPAVEDCPSLASSTLPGRVTAHSAGLLRCIAHAVDCGSVCLLPEHFWPDKLCEGAELRALSLLLHGLWAPRGLQSCQVGLIAGPASAFIAQRRARVLAGVRAAAWCRRLTLLRWAAAERDSAGASGGAYCGGDAPEVSADTSHGDGCADPRQSWGAASAAAPASVAVHIAPLGLHAHTAADEPQPNTPMHADAVHTPCPSGATSPQTPFLYMASTAAAAASSSGENDSQLQAATAASVTFSTTSTHNSASYCSRVQTWAGAAAAAAAAAAHPPTGASRTRPERKRGGQQVGGHKRQQRSCNEAAASPAGRSATWSSADLATEGRQKRQARIASNGTHPELHPAYTPPGGDMSSAVPLPGGGDSPPAADRSPRSGTGPLSPI